MSASIVCGVDGSADSQAALQVAIGLAKRLELRLVVAHVAEPAYIPYAAAVPFGGMAGHQAVMEELGTQEEIAGAPSRGSRRRCRPRRRRASRKCR